MPVHRTLAKALSTLLASSAIAVAASNPASAGAAVPVMFSEVAAPPVGGTYQPVVGNFSNAQYYDDVLWYSPGSGVEQLWTDTGNKQFSSTSLGNAVNGTFTPIVGDFSGDMLDDIVWYAPGPTADLLWTASGAGTFTPSALAVGGTYTPIVLDDLAGKDDIVWAAPNGGAGSVWSFSGAGTQHTSHPITTIAGTKGLTGNFDGDGYADLFWYGPGAIADAAWYGDGGGTYAKKAQSVGGTYQPIVTQMTPFDPIKGAEDDHTDDIVWYRTGAPSSSWEGSTGRSFSATIIGTFTTVGTPLPAPGRGRMWVWSPTQPDQGYQFKGIQATGNTEFGTGYTPIVGNWYGGGHEVLWYKPGAAPEALWL